MVMTSDQIAAFQTGKVECHALPCAGNLGLFTVDLNFSNPDRLARGEDFDRIANLYPSGEQGAGNDRAESADGKVPVDRQACRTVFIAWWQFL